MLQVYELGIQSCIVEGGSKTLQAFIDQSLYDEIHQFMGTETYLNNGVKAPKLPFDLYQKERRELGGNDILKVFVKG
jgi:riboflavin biosynthesis pyrimidine reductase